jgi:hypothetical protein
MFSRLRNENGNFTLVGLLAAVAVIMVLVFVVLLPKLNSTDKAVKEGLVKPKDGQTIYGASLDKAKETECSSNLRQIRMQISAEKTQSENGELPPTLDAMKISKSIQSCPVSKQPYVYNPTAGTVQCPTPGHEKL